MFDAATSTHTLTALRRPARANCSTASVCVAENRPAEIAVDKATHWCLHQTHATACTLSQMTMQLTLHLALSRHSSWQQALLAACFNQSEAHAAITDRLLLAGLNHNSTQRCEALFIVQHEHHIKLHGCSLCQAHLSGAVWEAFS